jgi:hypothetical protein
MSISWLTGGHPTTAMTTLLRVLQTTSSRFQLIMTIAVRERLNVREPPDAVAVTVIEVALIVSVMVAGGDGKVGLARDTVFESDPTRALVLASSVPSLNLGRPLPHNVKWGSRKLSCRLTSTLRKSTIRARAWVIGYPFLFASLFGYI